MINETVLKEAEETIIDIIKQQYPDLDLTEGTVIRNLIVGLASLGYALIKEDIDKLKDQIFLNNAIENPDNIDEATLDAILGNFLLYRKQGSKASGLIKITVNTYKDYFISSSAEFIFNDLVFIPDEDYTILADNLFKEGNNYYFYIKLIATEIGSKYMLPRGALLKTNALGSTVESVEVYEDFQGGLDKEDNSAFLQRAIQTLGQRGLYNKQSINSTLFAEFPGIEQIEVIGYNDREMQRDVNNLGIKVGGKIDIYLKTPISTIQIEKLTNSDGDFYLENSDVPILRIQHIARKTNPTITTTNFSTEIYSDTQHKDENPKFYRFSIYEKIKVKTDYPNTNLVITVDKPSLISVVQSYVNNEDNKYLNADILVKSFMPCFVSLIIKYKAEQEINEDTIKETILNFVNGYTDSILYASQIVDKLHDLGLIVILPVELKGVFHLPDGTTKTIYSNTFLKIDENYKLGISEKTFRFYITASDITLIKED